MTQPSAPDPNLDPEFWEALARYLAGESTAEESAQIRAWLAADPSRQTLLDALDRSLQPLAHQPPPDLDVDAALRRVHARIEQDDIVPLLTRGRERRAPAWRTTAVRIAAAVALVLGGTLLYRTLADRPDETAPLATAASYTTRIGQVDTIRLPDGTSVLLAPGSELVVPGGYGAAARTVALTGEALFDVIHDDARPFTVRAGNAVVVDLGTTFAVRSHDASDEVRVVVTAGSVLLRAEQPVDSGVVLRAGDRGVLARDGRSTATRAVVRADDVAWTRGQLIFQDASLDDVARELRRWYGLELRVADPALAGRHVTATFQGETVAQVLNVLELALGARIERRGDTATVRLSR